MKIKKSINKKDDQIKFEEEIKKSVDILETKIIEVEKAFKEGKEEMVDQYKQKLETMQSKKDALKAYRKLSQELSAEKWEENKAELTNRYKKAGDEINEAYEGIKTRLSYAFDKLKSQ